MKPYLLWIDYGSEGWMYVAYDTLEEVIERIQTNIGGPFIVTKRLNLELVEPK